MKQPKDFESIIDQLYHESLIIMLVNFKDILVNLRKDAVISTDDFNWQKVPKYLWINDKPEEENSFSKCFFK